MQSFKFHPRPVGKSVTHRRRLGVFDRLEVCNVLGHHRHDCHRCMPNRNKPVLHPETDLRNLPLALRSAYLALHRRTDAVLSPLGLTADQFVLMLALTEDETLTQKELADRISSDPSTIRAMLVLLEKKGMIIRRQHPKDLRAKAVSLSAAGRKKAKQAWSVSQPIRNQMNGSLQREQASMLIECLNTLANSLGVASQQTSNCDVAKRPITQD